MMRIVHKYIGFALAAVAVLFAAWRLSENSVDPDLWGHVLYGQRHVITGMLEKAEPFSWTAPGYPWINHEVGAELVMAMAHLRGGSRGLWLLMVTIGVITLVAAGMEARVRVAPGFGWTVWAVIAFASREVALGFAMRPQIFSCLAWVLFLIGTRHLVEGRRWPRVALPLLCIAWINTHGGVLLAIVGLVMMAVAATAVSIVVQRGGPEWLSRWCVLRGDSTTAAPSAALGLTTVLCVLALLANPYGLRLPAWLASSVAYVRPEITEWNPTQLTAGHAVFWVMAVGWIVAIVWMRARPSWWECVLGLLVLVAAARHERHVPLFALTMIVFLPGCLSRVLSVRTQARLSASAASTLALLLTMAVVFGANRTIEANASATRLAGRMQVAVDEYPINAIRFVQEAAIRGNAVVYFDWAQQALWELPDSRVSFDGRLDTCYPRELIGEHWRFFHEGSVPSTSLPIDQADWMLLPRNGPAVGLLAITPSWRLVYSDELAQVWVNTSRLESWKDRTPPHIVPLAGVISFPDDIAPRAAVLR